MARLFEQILEEFRKAMLEKGLAPPAVDAVCSVMGASGKAKPDQVLLALAETKGEAQGAGE